VPTGLAASHAHPDIVGRVLFRGLTASYRPVDEPTRD
jgi:hypothetical protein